LKNRLSLPKKVKTGASVFTVSLFAIALRADPMDNPADPLNHEGFVGHVYSVLLNRAAKLDDFNAHVNRLENRERCDSKLRRFLH